MKVKFADKTYEVLYIKEVTGKTLYAVEDEPNHIDWLVNVEVIDEEEESKDERIRKELTDYIKSKFENSCSPTPSKNILGNWIAWLEKQGEQKSQDKSALEAINEEKVEPKFKVGDWVVQENIGVYKVIEICKSWYEVIDSEDNHYSISFDKECMCHLWTIEDAKEGDVLWHSDSASNGIFIFKEIRNNGKVLCYCDYDSEDHFCLGEHHACCWTSSKYVKPATKEQRDLLFAKMHEAGFEWNEEKKELKNLKEKSENYKQQLLSEMTDLIKDYIQQKPVWTEEDDLMLKDTLEFIETGWSGNGKSHLVYWLKSIKDKFK